MESERKAIPPSFSSFPSPVLTISSKRLRWVIAVAAALLCFFEFDIR